MFTTVSPKHGNRYETFDIRNVERETNYRRRAFKAYRKRVELRRKDTENNVCFKTHKEYYKPLKCKKAPRNAANVDAEQQSSSIDESQK